MNKQMNLLQFQFHGLKPVLKALQSQGKYHRQKPLQNVQLSGNKQLTGQSGQVSYAAISRPIVFMKKPYKHS